MRDVNVHVPILVKMLFGLLFPPIRLLEEIDRMLRPILSFLCTITGIRLVVCTLSLELNLAIFHNKDRLFKLFHITFHYPCISFRQE